MKKLLKDIAVIGAGQGAPQGENNYCEDGIPFVKAGNLLELIEGKDIFKIQKVNDEVARKHKLKLYPAGTVLFAKSGMSCLKGYVYVLPTNAYVVSHLACIIPMEDISVFLKFYFNYHKPNQLIKDAAYPSISLSDVGNLEIELGNEAERASIIKILTKTENIISLYLKELKSLDNLIKARFVEMFGDLANPKCLWEKCKLIEACIDKDDIKCGPFGTHLSKDEYTDTGVAVWEIPQINSAFVMKPMHFLTEKKAEELNAYKIISGDIAMSRKGNVGKCAVFPDDYPDGIIHSDVLRIRVDSKKVNSIFMMCQLHYSREVKRQIEMVSSGAIMAGINVTKLKRIYVHIPPMELQNKFADFAKQVDKSKVVQELAQCFTYIIRNKTHDNVIRMEG